MHKDVKPGLKIMWSEDDINKPLTIKYANNDIIIVSDPEEDEIVLSKEDGYIYYFDQPDFPEKGDYVLINSQSLGLIDGFLKDNTNEFCIIENNGNLEPVYMGKDKSEWWIKKAIQW